MSRAAFSRTQDLEKMVDTTDEWIVTRTGMKERRLAAQDEFTSDMGLAAAKEEALERPTSLQKPLTVFSLLLTRLTMFSAHSCLVRAALGAKCAAAVDVQAACTGYLYTLAMARAFVESGIYKNVLVVASEKLSTIVDYKDRNTCILFGDGASACVVSSEGKGLVIQNVVLGSDGEYAGIVILPGGGSRNPATAESLENKLHYLRMEGKEVFERAVRRMESACQGVDRKGRLEEEDISWLIPHQANIRIIEALAKRFQVPTEKVYITIHNLEIPHPHHWGSPHELLKEQKVTSQEHILLTAFGAGLTWGAAVLTHRHQKVAFIFLGKAPSTWAWEKIFMMLIPPPAPSSTKPKNF